MKKNKKKALGFYNKKRKTDRDRHIEKYLEDYYDETELEDMPEEAPRIDDDDEYIVDYKYEGWNGSPEYGYGEYGEDGGAEDTENYYSDDGYGPDGYDEDEYNEDEYYEDGYNEDEYYEDEYNEDGYNEDGYNEGEYYEDGYNEDEYYEDEYNEDGYNEDEYYEDEYNEDGYDDDDEFDISYEGSIYPSGQDLTDGTDGFWQRLRNWFGGMTAFDVILAVTGVAVAAAAVVILWIFLQQGHIDEQIESIAPLGSELENMGIVGNDGLLAIADAALSGNFDEAPSTEETTTEQDDKNNSSNDKAQTGKVNVSFVSVEKDLKIRFTDEHTGELITGTVFEVTLTNKKGKKLVLTDDDMDGIIYAQNVNAGVFEAVITSTEKYSFPAAAQQVTVKDKVEYVVINVQDEVKTEKQVNVAQEDTQKNDAAIEAEVLKDTVEWVESTKMPVVGTEGYLPVDKNTIADPSKVSLAAKRMLFDALNVSLDKNNITLVIGTDAQLKGTDFSDSKDGDIEYKYTKEWKSSDDKVASVEGGKVTAKAAGTAVITYTVTRKTITTTYEQTESAEEMREISVDEYKELSEEEKKKCTPIKDDADQIIGYTYKRVTEPVKKTTETLDTASAECTVTVEAAKIEADNGKKPNTGDDTEVTATEPKADDKAGDLALALDRTKDVNIAVGGTTTLVAAVTGHKSDAGVTWETSDNKVATVDEKGTVTGVAPGSVKITAVTKEKNAKGENLKAECVVTVNSNASSDTTTKLKDKNGNQIYVKNGDGTYREAVYADYFATDDFYIITQPKYIYTGWQTIDGKTYYYDKNGNAVTGTQIIQGVTYNFGTDGAIASETNGTAFGIDVSRHNGKIDWGAVKASGVDYVIIRCGYRGSSSGVLIEDQTFKTNIKGAAAAGLKVGVYVFSQAINEVEAVKEASLAVSLVQGYNLTYPIFIDTESSGGRADKIDKATRTAVVNAFCQTVASAGYKPGIYASKTWFEGKLNMGAVGNYKIWLAQYSAAPTYKGKYDMWQYSDKGKIGGIKTAVDLNYSYLGY